MNLKNILIASAVAIGICASTAAIGARELRPLNPDGIFQKTNVVASQDAKAKQETTGEASQAAKAKKMNAPNASKDAEAKKVRRPIGRSEIYMPSARSGAQIQWCVTK